jgi:predicted enzyme related to lactoylglutathione lyase
VNSDTPDGATIVGVDVFGPSTQDAARLIAFYRDTLGMTPTVLDESGRGAEFTLADGATFAVRQFAHSPSGAGYGAFFAVGDIHAAVERFRARGADIMNPFETPVCFMAFAKDPDGNMFGIHQRKKS